MMTSLLPSEDRRFAPESALVLGVLLSLVLVGCNSTDNSASTDAGNSTDTSLTLPEGFRATVVAEDLGSTRHLTVAENGDVYAAVRDTENGGGIAALRDTTGDYTADRTEYFGDTGGTGIGLRDGYLYFGADTALWRYEKASNELVPSGDKETIVGGFPEQGEHAVKPFAFGGNGNLYVNVGAPSNACMEETRTKGSPGQDPCPLLEEHAGIWQYQADETGQQHSPDARYASGIRNAVALTWNDAVDSLYALQHGRDQLHQFFPDLYTQKESAELPAEEFFKVDDGDDFGWPYCYYDWKSEKKVLMPEYGGDGTEVGRCDQFENPIQAFPGHWAPNAVLFYDGTQFPEKYQGGAFIAWHGSWNRAPFQEGYKVTFTPFNGDAPSGEFEVFADGFTGADTLRNPDQAEHRPTGLAVGPDGGLYVSDDENGTIWRIAYVGKEN
jgi:glucose/arabinose dehydrogenase